MKLLVSIHDVSPAFDDEVRTLWSLCAERGVRPALLVVPDWHGRWPLEADRRFLRWLRARAGDGADVFLHGARHDEEGLPRGIGDALRAFGRTAREGEFLTLGRGEATWRMREGVRRLRALGLSPIGFVAPAWLWRAEARWVVGELGLRASEDTQAIYLHDRGTRLPSPVVRWSARTAARAHASALVADAMSWWHRRHWLVRVALHPRDLSHPATRRSVERTLDRWLAVRRPFPYSSL